MYYGGIRLMALTPNEKARALDSLCPNSFYTMVDTTITWIADNGTSQPSDSEIEAEWNKIKYKDQRRDEYPTVEAQLDDLYHNGIDGWKATIKKTKDKYPKP